MNTQAILITAVALLLGTATAFIKRPSATADELNKPEFQPDNELIRPAPITRKVLPSW
jgi:tryptophan-rich sensory protein